MNYETNHAHLSHRLELKSSPLCSKRIQTHDRGKVLKPTSYLILLTNLSHYFFFLFLHWLIYLYSIVFLFMVFKIQQIILEKNNMWQLSHGKRTYSQTKVSASTKKVFLIIILVESYCRMVTLIPCKWGGKAVELERPYRTLVFPFRGKWGVFKPLWGHRGSVSTFTI